MFEDMELVRYNRRTDEIVILNTSKLPFELRGINKLTGKDIYKWINDRLNNINRTYMNLVYIARDVGRDNNKIIADSSGISVTDNFWIKTSDIDLNWSKILNLRDTNLALSNLALNGKLKISDALKDGKTSLFTLKGHFPKAIINGYMYKKKNDSMYEYVAYLVGKQLGINIQECSLDGNYVKIKLFTNNNVSLVHASQLKYYFGNDDILYNNLIRTDRKDLVEQLQRLYIFNYIIGNPDLHEENYGLLYDTRSFKILQVAQCFDHNCAFDDNFIGITNDVDLEELAERFIKYHMDIANRAYRININEMNKYLKPMQLDQLKSRIKNIIVWSGIV